MTDGWNATSYSDPRTEAAIEDWPLGRDKRGTATFTVEHDKRGERVSRTTTGKPIKSTYAVQSRIVTGDDGRIYLAIKTAFGHISIMRGDMKYSHEAVFPTDPRFAEISALFN